jgi:ABC-type sugar transport system ATPase subunit
MRDGRTVGTSLASETNTDDVIKLMIGRDAAHVFRKASHTRESVVLRVRDLVTNTGLQGVSFDLHAGEILGVFGLLGSGRTELARVLFGADPIASGTIEEGTGRPRRRRESPYRVARRGIGLVPEERTTQGLFSQLSILDNVSVSRPGLYSRYGVIREARRRELVGGIAKRVRLKADSILQPASALSGGNQQKVVLGRWMLGGSRVLILDDPTAGVDVGAKQDIYRLIADLTEDGTAVLLMSSELPEVIGLSDRVLVMFEGGLNQSFRSDAVTEEMVLRAAHGRAA